jgi:hypothetical protein
VTTRHQDDGSSIYQWADPEVLVTCPRCAACARVGGSGLGRHRLTCAECGLARDSGTTSSWGEPVDPWFRLPLWLRTEVDGEVLWAFNARHLEVLRSYVAARHRDRAHGGRPSMLESLPTWLTSARNRDRVLAAIAELEARLP